MGLKCVSSFCVPGYGGSDGKLLNILCGWAPWVWSLIMGSLVLAKLRQYHADFVMADPVQLRKCEELLGKLPEEAPARLRNPVWTFLREIEGFDNLRASECLVKLLDKHYDTIAVLKLATKRDLVEDAGILPGDALRIVAAAKSYVTPRDADPNPGTSTSPTGAHLVASFVRARFDRRQVLI